MFKTIISPSISDMNALRHVSNTVIPHWFESARSPLYTLFNPSHDLTYKKWNLMLVHMDFNFIKPVYFGYDVEIRTYITKISKSSLTLSQEVWQNGQLRLNGNCVMLYYDYIKQESNLIPDNIRNKLMNHLISSKELEEKNRLEMKNKKENKKEFIESD